MRLILHMRFTKSWPDFLALPLQNGLRGPCTYPLYRSAPEGSRISRTTPTSILSDPRVFAFQVAEKGQGNSEIELRSAPHRGTVAACF